MVTKMSAPVGNRPLSEQWLSEDRIQEAILVWSKAYRRPISEDDAIEILTNVRRLAEILLRAEEEKRAAAGRSPVSAC